MATPEDKAAVAKVAKATVGYEKAVAPCGSEYRKGYLSQHARFCKKPGCTKEVQP
jgi:hypothetical protein